MMTGLLQTADLRIEEIQTLISPYDLLRECPATLRATWTVYEARRDVSRILKGLDDRLLVVLGPCSIHDVQSACEFASRLRGEKEKLSADLFIVMRVYFEKPRTTIGWKGLINDPYLNGTYRINDGLRMARKLLIDINETGVPAAVEFLDTITPQYIGDIVSWGAIGARTTESQLHREMASGLSCPIGFKNGTEGNLRVAVDAVVAAQQPHHFVGVTKSGRAAIVSTIGNNECHIILRGGKRPNYDAGSLAAACSELAAAGLAQRVMIDFSHSNSQKNHLAQTSVGQAVAEQIAAGNRRIIGVMIESHLKAGRQDLIPGKDLVYGQSITDSCLGWEDTARLLKDLAAAVQRRRSSAKQTIVELSRVQNAESAAQQKN